MPRDITHELPPAIARHLAACNGHAFAAKEIFGDRVTFTPLSKPACLTR